jgi:hypothetical protein
MEETAAPDRILASLVAHDDCAAIFRTFYADQQSYRPDRGSRLVASEIPSARDDAGA